MKYFLIDKVLRNKRLIHSCLFFLSSWYIFWICMGTLAMIVQIFLGFNRPDFYTVSRPLFTSVFLIIKMGFYYRVTRILGGLIFSKSSADLRTQGMVRLSLAFFYLFLLDSISLFNGKFYPSSTDTAKDFMKVLTEGSTIYEIYSKIYIYIPMVFDFINPQIEGTALLVTSVVLLSLSKNECSVRN